jgi:hypothetical protein
MAPASSSIAYCGGSSLAQGRRRRYFNVVAMGELVIAKQANGVNGDMTNGVEEFG